MWKTKESVIRNDAEPFNEEETTRIVGEFYHRGYCFFEDILTREETRILREVIQVKYSDPAMYEEDIDQIRGISLMRMFEYDINYRDLIFREPFVSIAEAILGKDCHMMSQNALRYEPGAGGGWHVDDRVHFPLPDDVLKHDSRVPPPCLVLNILFPLSDMTSIGYGVTEVVPGSHFSGRNPNSSENPTFNGQSAVSLFSKPGDAIMFHNQVWHRGSPNQSQQVRYVGSVVYSQRIIGQRLYPFIDYRMPEYVWEGTDERMQRLLGRHGKGAYG